MKKYKYCVFIAKFAMCHNGHQLILKESLKITEKLIIVIGSSNTARTIKNPWSATERREMLLSLFSKEEQQRIIFIDMRDYLYNENIWTLTLQQKINEITNYNEDIVLASFKNDSSVYLKSFPQYSRIEFEYNDDNHSSHLREKYFSYNNSYSINVPKNIKEYLDCFQKTAYFSSLKEEFDFIQKYKADWADAPYPPTFVTVDNVVLKSGHILLVKRKFNPGKGLYALPGGFLNQKEKIQDAALRELKEETKIAVHLPDLRKAVNGCHVYDDPERSSRGRTITHAFLVDLGVGQLPKIKGEDDALTSHWMPLNEVFLNEDKFFDDHYHIICHTVNKF